MVKNKQTENNNDIVELEYREHVLKRAGMYIGATVLTEAEKWIIDDDDKLSFKKVSFVPGVQTIVNEIIDNSLDEHQKTNFQYATKVSITIDKTTCSVEDNGRGIPVKKTEKGEWMPVVAFCNGMAGSNFNDDNRPGLGQNGTGSKCTNFFSKSFEAVTCDGQGKLKVVCKDNGASTKVTELTPTERTGTKVTFSPDFDRFGIKCFDETTISLLKTRLKFLSWFFPKCNITLNGEKMAMKVKDISNMFPSPFTFVSNENVYIGVFPSDEPYLLTYLNGRELKTGTHVDYITSKIVTDIREKVSKKLKNIKPSDIKNRLSFVVLLNNFPKCTFTSQTKEELANAPSEVGEFLRANTDLDQLSAKVLKEKEILDNITDIFKAKEEIAASKKVEKEAKARKDFDSKKYFPPVDKSGHKYLMIVEGESAFSGISPILSRKGIGYYMLKGKPENVLEESPSKFMLNQEVRELVQILGFSPTRPDENTNMNYEKVVILSDADADGCAIAGLVISMFFKIAPKMLEDGRICRMDTPLLIGLDSKDTVEEYYFAFPDKKSMKPGLKYFYVKGLGSWSKNRLNQVIDKEGGLDKLIHSYKVDETTTKTIMNWFGQESGERKKALRGREFHIDNA